jgi:hypothetical protein
MLCLAISGQVFAQTTKTDADEFKISDKLSEKAYALLQGLTRDAEQFQQPDNRVSARGLVADLLWKKDEKQSRLLFQSAINELDTLIGGLLVDDGTGDEQYYEIYTIGELRKSLLLQIAGHDSAFSLSAFKTLSRNKEDGTPLFEGDDTLELELAKNIADNDPEKALEVALKNLETGLGYGIFDTLENIHKKDSELGAKFAQAILKKIKKDSLRKPARINTNANANVSPTPAIPGEEAEITVWQIKEFVDKVSALNRKSIKDKKGPLLTDAEYRELIEILARKYATQQYLSSYEVAGVMKDIESYFPSLALTIRRRLVSEKDNLDKMIVETAFDVEIEDKQVKEIIQIIEKKPIGQRDALFHKAAETVFAKGDIIGSKELYDLAKTKPEYDYLGDQINAVLPRALAEEGNIEDVRETLATAKTSEDKIEILTSLSYNLAKKGNVKSAKMLADEAQALYLGKMKNRRNMNSVLQLSQSYAVIDSNQGFSSLESNLSFVNELIAAGIILDEYNETGSVKNDELLLSSVLPASYQNMPKGVSLIRDLSNADFERTVGLADRFSRREVRFAALFRIVQALLDPKAEEIETANQQMYEGEGC